MMKLGIKMSFIYADAVFLVSAASTRQTRLNNTKGNDKICEIWVGSDLKKNVFHLYSSLVIWGYTNLEMEHSFIQNVSPDATFFLKSIIRDKMKHIGLHKLYLVSVPESLNSSSWK